MSLAKLAVYHTPGSRGERAARCRSVIRCLTRPPLSLSAAQSPVCITTAARIQHSRLGKSGATGVVRIWLPQRGCALQPRVGHTATYPGATMAKPTATPAGLRRRADENPKCRKRIGSGRCAGGAGPCPEVISAIPARRWTSPSFASSATETQSASRSAPGPIRGKNRALSSASPARNAAMAGKRSR